MEAKLKFERAMNRAATLSKFYRAPTYLVRGHGYYAVIQGPMDRHPDELILCEFRCGLRGYP